MKTGLFFTCCVALCILHTACAAPIGSESDKSGEEEAHHATAPKSVNLEEKVREAVHKAEEAASLAAQDSVRHGHKAETRVIEFRDHKPTNTINDNEDMEGGKQESVKHLRKQPPPAQNSEDGSHTKRVKEHRVNQKPRGYSKMTLGGLNDGGTSNSYKEDTSLEDRLAMEAEEEKKYENGEGYGGGENWGQGGGGGGGKSASWASNIQRQDAAEKQSIQAQVASESAHELDEIQRAITAESQSSRGSATMGNTGATVVQVNDRQMSDQGRMQAQARQETAQAIRAAEAQNKPLGSGPASSVSQAQFGNMIGEGQSYGNPEESEGGSQSLSQANVGGMSQGFTGMGQGSLGGQGAVGIGQGSIGGGGLGGGLNQGSLGGALTGGGGLGGGATEAGGLGGGSLSTEGGAMGAAAFSATGGRLGEAGVADGGANYGRGVESPMSRMEGGGTDSSMSRMMGGGAESSMSRMMDGGADSSMSRMMGGGADSSMSRMMGGGADSSMSRMMGGGAVSPMSSMMGGSMQNMASLMGQQAPGRMLQSQGMLGGAASMLGGGAGALQTLGAGGQFAGYKKSTIPRPDNHERSKTERVKDKHKKSKQSKHSRVQKVASGSHKLQRSQIQQHKRRQKHSQTKERKSNLPVHHHSKHH